ncbi:MAG: BtpA/SgcQ family protein [Bacteroidota bacterium]
MAVPIRYSDLFPERKPLIACIHLLALPGAPLYGGKPSAIYERALAEAETFARHGVDGLIVENFRDVPFYPDRVPNETVAAMAAVGHEIRKAVKIPLGINVLRNDADAALSIAAAIGADFIRVNVHNAAVLTDQGIVQGRAYATLRKRDQLRAPVLIFADVAVKHAAPIAALGLDIEARDLSERSLADALIVSGSGTGAATQVQDLEVVQQNTHLPVVIGSGTNPSNLRSLHSLADGFIVGSYFKRDGKADNAVEEARVRDFCEIYAALA